MSALPRQLLPLRTQTWPSRCDNEFIIYHVSQQFRKADGIGRISFTNLAARQLSKGGHQIVQPNQRAALATWLDDAGPVGDQRHM